MICSTWHWVFPTRMEAFSLLKPVPVTVKKVPWPIDPEKVDENSILIAMFLILFCFKH